MDVQHHNDQSQANRHLIGHVKEAFEQVPSTFKNRDEVQQAEHDNECRDDAQGFTAVTLTVQKTAPPKSGKVRASKLRANKRVRGPIQRQDM